MGNKERSTEIEKGKAQKKKTDGINEVKKCWLEQARLRTGLYKKKKSHYVCVFGSSWEASEGARSQKRKRIKTTITPAEKGGDLSIHLS